MAMCPASSTCLNLLGDPVVGVCATEVGHGDECNLDDFVVCPIGEACANDDPADPASPTHCRTDCTDDGVCAVGMCMDAGGGEAYCYE
jgi:hypothetical protein